MIVGAVLFVNARLLLGKVDAQGAPVLHLFVGGLQTAIPFHLIARVRITEFLFVLPSAKTTNRAQPKGPRPRGAPPARVAG